MHKIAILVLDGVIAMDMAIPLDIFSMTKSREGKPIYDVRVCGSGSYISGSLFRLALSESLDWFHKADTVIVPGLLNISQEIPVEVIEALRCAADRGTRIASICTGAFVLAEAGLLDGLRATTHWETADVFAKRFPQIRVEPDILFTDNGQILTSAGVASGVDLCLHMIRNDHGAAVAAKVAQFIVMPLERGGGQLQMITHETPDSQDNLSSILLWIVENLQRELQVAQLAELAKMSIRTFNRKFKEQTGTTPLQWILAARIKRAQQLLETTDLSIEHVATAVGFESSDTFRDRFKRIVGVSPLAWRNTYRDSHVQT